MLNPEDETLEVLEVENKSLKEPVLPLKIGENCSSSKSSSPASFANLIKKIYG